MNARWQGADGWRKNEENANVPNDGDDVGSGGDGEEDVENDKIDDEDDFECKISTEMQKRR